MLSEEIRNQVYDEKNNAVIIIVVCCSHEKIRDKLCCKAGKSIKSIEIMENKPKPPPPEKSPPPVQKPPPPVQKPPPEPCGPPPQTAFPVSTCCTSCYEGRPGGPCYGPVPQPPGGPPPQTAFPVSMCCTSCYEGRPGGPCYGPGPGPIYPNYGYYGRPFFIWMLMFWFFE